jgi:AmiR/NasT family two-component response regulator
LGSDTGSEVEREMSCKVLVVEDEIFVAIDIESVLQELGHRPLGIAADSRRA